jgi:hypothetical protein
VQSLELLVLDGLGADFGEDGLVFGGTAPVDSARGNGHEVVAGARHAHCVLALGNEGLGSLVEERPLVEGRVLGLASEFGGGFSGVLHQVVELVTPVAQLSFDFPLQDFSWFGEQVSVVDLVDAVGDLLVVALRVAAEQFAPQVELLLRKSEG